MREKPYSHTPNSSDRERAVARRRRRRIVFNSDGDDLLMPAYGGWHDPIEDMPERIDSLEQFYGLRLNALRNTHVDTLFYGGYINEPVWDYPQERIKVLGPDPLCRVVDFARANNFEFFLSIRMNDLHCSFSAGPAWWPKYRLQNSDLFLLNVGKEEFEERFLPWINGVTREHPLKDVQHRLGSAGWDQYAWSCYDWSLAAVRKRFLALIENACRRYDLDGIELDWSRSPFYFPFGAEQRNIPVMNDFVRSVHQCVLRRSESRGKPILLAQRVFDTVELTERIGLDPLTWLENGWIDLLIPGSAYMPFSFPIGEWIELGNRYDVPVYPAVNRSVLPFDRDSVRQAMRAFAYRCWKYGADGVYPFNVFYFKGDEDCLQEIGEPDQLARMNKLYQLDHDLLDFGAGNRMCICGLLPKTFTTESGPGEAELELEVFDDPAEAVDAFVQIQINPSSVVGRVQLTLNEHRLSSPRNLPPEEKPNETLSERWSGVALRPGELNPADRPEPPWFQYEAQDALRVGRNRFRIQVAPPNSGNGSDAVDLLQIRVLFVYP